jgi:hypothetical protein
MNLRDYLAIKLFVNRLASSSFPFVLPYPMEGIPATKAMRQLMRLRASFL